MGDLRANLIRPDVTPPAAGGMRLEHHVDADWWHLPEHRRDAICAWLVRNGITDDRYILGMRLVNEGAIELHCYALNADGRPYLDAATGEVPTYRTVVPVAEPPPPEWWDDTEARP